MRIVLVFCFVLGFVLSGNLVLAQSSSQKEYKEIGIWKKQKEAWGTPSSSSANGMMESYWRFNREDKENMELTWVFDAQGRFNRAETSFNLFDGNASILMINQPMILDNFQYFNTNYLQHTGLSTRFVVRW